MGVTSPLRSFQNMCFEKLLRGKQISYRVGFELSFSNYEVSSIKRNGVMLRSNQSEGSFYVSWQDLHMAFEDFAR